MAHLWQRTASGGWDAVALFPPEVEITTGGVADTAADSNQTAPIAKACLRLVPQAGGEAWVLLAARDQEVRLNGEPLALGLAVLRDKDGIQVGVSDTEHRCYFSAERLARIEPYDAPARAACPRCKQTMEPGQLAVRCPQCGVWHHQLPERECWTYSAHCAACQQQPTPLDTGFRWTPEHL